MYLLIIIYLGLEPCTLLTELHIKSVLQNVLNYRDAHSSLCSYVVIGMFAQSREAK